MGDSIYINLDNKYACESFKSDNNNAFKNLANVNEDPSIFSNSSKKKDVLHEKKDIGIKCEVEIKNYTYNKNQSIKVKPDKNTPKLDGEIGNFKQGKTGDCYLLSALKSLSATKKGANIIKDSITNVGEGVVVKFQGGIKNISEVYVSNEEIMKAKADAKAKKENSLSTMDDDVLVLELAIEKYKLADIVRKVDNGTLCPNKNEVTNELAKPTILKGGHAQEILELLTGREKQVKKFDEIANFENIKNLMNNGPVVLSVKKDDSMFKTLDFGKVKLVKSHAYVLKDIDKDFIVLQNPHDTSKDIKVPTEQIINHGHSNNSAFELQYINLNDSNIKTHKPLRQKNCNYE